MLFTNFIFTTFYIFVVFVFLTKDTIAQTDTDSLSFNSKLKTNFVKTYQVNEDFNSFRINPETMFLNVSSQEIIPPSMLWTGTRMFVSDGGLPYGLGVNTKTDMLKPYYNFYIESKNIGLFRKVLGMAQLGAVGYLAYKHIKKYGLFHQP